MRDDLDLKSYAISLGYEIELHEHDIINKRTNYPNHDLTFKKENLRIWRCGRSWPEVKLWWQARNITNGVFEPYETRREYNTLKEALDNER